MKLWTVSLDYFATGEGRTFFGWIGYADEARDAIKRFGFAFGDYFAKVAVAKEGFVQDEIISHLFSPAALSQVRQLDGRATVELAGSLHWNLA